MIFSLLEKLNSIKKFSFYFITPTIYAIGNASEQINLAVNYVKKRDKKLIILKIYIFQKLLKYNVCNNELFNSENFNTKYLYKKNLLTEALSFLVNIEFFFKRLIFLSLKKKNKI